MGLLVDQKLNDGIAVPFFGHPAMTAPALAVLARRFSAALVPARIVRLGPARLRAVIDAPCEWPVRADHHEQIQAMMAVVNRRLERWIEAHPDQWLLLHRRWDKTMYARP